MQLPTALPDPSALTSLQAQPPWLQIPHGAARSLGAHVAADARALIAAYPLTALPDLSALTSLQKLNLERCRSSRRCPTCRRSQTSRWACLTT